MGPPPAKKQKKDDDALFLDYFWKLADGSGADRADAAGSLASYLGSKRVTREKLDYALRRLVRGLASPRGEARQGFGGALSLLLARDIVSPVEVAASLAKELDPATLGQEKQDARLAELGIVLACVALGRAGAEIETETREKVVRRLLTLFKKRKWLRETCTVALGWILRGAGNDVLEAEVLTVAYGEEAEFDEDDFLETADPERVALAMMISAGKKTSKIGFFDEDFETALLPRLSGALSRAASASFPAVHLLWELVLARCGLVKPQLLPEEPYFSSTSAGAGLWEIVDNHVASGTLSRRANALLIAQRVLFYTSSAEDDMLRLDLALSPAVVCCLVGAAASTKKSHLEPLAHKFLRNLCNNSKKTPNWRVNVALRLLNRGDVRFDARTKTKTVALLLKDADDASAARHFEFALDKVMDDHETWGLDSLTALGKVIGTTAAEQLRCLAILATMRVAFFTTDGGSVTEMEEEDDLGLKGALESTTMAKLVKGADLPAPLRAHAREKLGAMLFESTRGELRRPQLRAYNRAAQAWLHLEARGLVRLNDGDEELRDSLLEGAAGLKEAAMAEEEKPDYKSRAVWSLALAGALQLLTQPEDSRAEESSLLAALGDILAFLKDEDQGVGLARASVELLDSAPASQRKFLRFTVTRCWTLLAASKDFDFSPELISVFVDAVCGVSEEAEEESESDDGEDDAEIEEMDEMDEDDVNNAADLMNAAESEDDEADDIMVSGDALATLLEDESGVEMAKKRVEFRKSGRLEAARESIQAQLRCMDVLEKVLARSNLGVGSAIPVAWRLTELVGRLEELTSSSKDTLSEAADLSRRVVALLKKRLSKAPAASSSEEQRIANDCLKEALSARVSSSGGKKSLHAQMIEATCGLCCRGLTADVQEAATCYAEALQRTLGSRKARGGLGLFENLVEKHPELARAALLPELPKLATSAPSTFLCLRAADLAKSLFKKASRTDGATIDEAATWAMLTALAGLIDAKSAALAANPNQAKQACDAAETVLHYANAKFTKKKKNAAVDALLKAAQSLRTASKDHAAVNRAVGRLVTTASKTTSR